MIRTPEKDSDITISIWLRNGDSFEKKDITDKPFGDNERIVSFWDGDSVTVLPMSDVSKCSLHFTTTEK